MILRLFLLLALTCPAFSQTPGLVLVSRGGGGGLPPGDTPPGGIELPYAVNCAGPQFTAADGLLFRADENFTGGSISTYGAAIANTEDDTLYQSERFGVFSYAIATGNGNFTVRLRLAENYVQVVGNRHNDITVEGVAALSNFDIFQSVGFRTAVEIAVEVTVSDGTLNIVATDSGPGDTILNAFSIRTTVAAAPDAPVLAATAGNGQVTLTLPAGEPLGTTEMRVWRATSASVSTAGAATFTNATFPLIDTGRTNGTTYFYRAKALNGTGASADSNEVSATPVDPTPDPEGLVYWLNDSTADSGSAAGSDAANGTQATPYLTLGRALQQYQTDTGRTAHGVAAPIGFQGATIKLRAGRYRLTSMVTIDDRHSGITGAPFVIEAHSSEAVVITGAIDIPIGGGAAAWNLVSVAGDAFGNARLPAPASTYVLNTNAVSGYSEGSLPTSFDGLNNVRVLIDDGVLIPWSTFPSGASDTEAGTMDVTSAVNSGTGGLITTFTVGTATPTTWNESGQNIMTYGPGGRAWALYFEAVSTITGGPTTSTVTIPSRMGSFYPWNSSDGLFWQKFYNVMEATTAGTHTWAFAQDKFYYRPTAGGEPTGTSIAQLPTAIRLGHTTDAAQAANHVEFRDLIFEGTTNRAVEVYFAENGVHFENVTFRNAGGTGLYVRDAYNVTVDQSDFIDLMQIGAEFSSIGDKTLLLQSGCAVTNSTFTRTGWGIADQNKAALMISANGCGFDVSGCTFMDNYSRSVLFDSAYVRIDNNIINGDCRTTGDTGAISNGRKLTDIGGEITNNTISEILLHPNGNTSFSSVMGVYLDDCMSWTLVTDNDLTNCYVGMQIASGKKVRVLRNKFQGCATSGSNASIIIASRAFFPIESTLLTEITTTYPVHNALWLAANPDIVRFRVGGDLNSLLRRPWQIEAKDNVFADGAFAFRVHAQIAADFDVTQLNYPLPTSFATTPINGGGTQPISAVDRP